MKNRLLIAATIIALGIIYLWATPYLAVRGLKNAVKEKDAVAITDKVNFPALRESVKGAVSAKMGQELAKEKDSPFVALGMAVAGALVNNLVDAMVTPEAISAMVETGKFQKNKGAVSDTTPAPASDKDDPETTMGYEKLDRFVVNIKGKGSDTKLGMVFKREGLFTWRLSALRLPM